MNRSAGNTYFRYCLRVTETKAVILVTDNHSSYFKKLTQTFGLPSLFLFALIFYEGYRLQKNQPAAWIVVDVVTGGVCVCKLYSVPPSSMTMHWILAYRLYFLFNDNVHKVKKSLLSKYIKWFNLYDSGLGLWNKAYNAYVYIKKKYYSISPLDALT